MTDWRTTRVTELLGLDLPLVLGAFGGVSSVALTAAVSRGGGLGSFGLYGYDAERIERTAAQLRAATSGPFALNLWVPRDADEQRMPDAAEFAAWLAPLLPLYEAAGVAPPELPESFLPSYADQVDAVLAARPAALSLVFGPPDAALVDRARALGIRLLGTATTVEEALALEEAGVDAVIASGSDAGGHRVSFLRPAEDSLVGTMSLVPQVVDAVSVPVIAAGGISDGRGVAAALVLGAHAATLGSALLAADESAAPTAHRDALAGEGARRTVLTSAMSGRLARGIPNRAMRELEAARTAAGETAAPFPAQNWLTGRFRAAAATRDDAELLSLWAGQAAPLARRRPAAETLAEVVATVDALLG